MSDMTQEHFTEKEAAAFLRVARTTLQRQRLAGKVDFYRIGAKVVYHRSQLEAYLKSRVRAAYAINKQDEMRNAA